MVRRVGGVAQVVRADMGDGKLTKLPLSPKQVHGCLGPAMPTWAKQPKTAVM